MYQGGQYAVLSLRTVLRGAEEACWAHNPKVLGSKPSGAISFATYSDYYATHTQFQPS